MQIKTTMRFLVITIMYSGQNAVSILGINLDFPYDLKYGLILDSLQVPSRRKGVIFYQELFMISRT